MQQEQPTAQPPFAAFIGIDWSDRKHDICLRVAGDDHQALSVLDHRPASIEAWAADLRDRFGGRPIAVCIELSQGPIVSALLEHDFFVIFPVNPSTLAKYRRAFTPSRAKDDPSDAQVALDILLRHPEKLSPLRRDSPDMRALRRLVEARRDLVQGIRSMRAVADGERGDAVLDGACHERHGRSGRNGWNGGQIAT